MRKKIILSLGGSLIVPDGVDACFLKKFRKLIIDEVKKGKKFVIVCGGGKLNSRYNEASRKIIKLNNKELDWLGIHATRFNANFVRILFKELAYKETTINPYQKVKTAKPIIVAAGYEPGWSTDYDATYLAKAYGSEKLINLSNIDYAYDKDPKKFKNARPIKEIGWADFRKIVGNKWLPRMNKPFDPIAARAAQELELKVVILNGKNIGNLKRCLNEEKFKGTIIR